MSAFELRQAIESAIPWWAPFALPLVAALLYWLVWAGKEYAKLKRCDRGEHVPYFSQGMGGYACRECRKFLQERRST